MIIKPPFYQTENPFGLQGPMSMNKFFINPLMFSKKKPRIQKERMALIYSLTNFAVALGAPFPITTYCY